MVFVKLGCSLQKSGMEIKDITGVGLSSWGSSEEEGHLSVSNSLLGEIVVDDKSVHSIVSEIFSNGAS